MDLLRAWERAAALPPAQRALSLLATASDGAPDTDPVDCPLGERDARLLKLRESVFGQEMSAVVRCPGCFDEREVDFSVDSLRTARTTHSPGTLSFSEQGYEMEFRLPNSGDLLALQSAGGEVAVLRTRLLERCLLHSLCNGEPISAAALPEAIQDAISRRMSEADPQAQVVLRLHCDQCGHAWLEDFQIDAFLWTEIHAWAGRLLNEVHELACAYGWSEAQILELSPQRRSVYLNLIAE